MKAAVLSMNPAVDVTILVDGFGRNQVNRARSFWQTPGGKGVNVASFLRDLDVQVTITGLLGSENSQIFEKLFSEKEILDRFVRIPGQTRTGIKIVDETTQQTTDINLPGLVPPSNATAEVTCILDAVMQDCPWLVLTGSLPPGIPEDFYAAIIEKAARAGIRTVLDTSGNALLLGLASGADLVKPNLTELTEISPLPFDCTDEKGLVESARKVLNHAEQIAVISSGARGSLYVTKQIAFHAAPPVVPVISTVGAGDAMVAGLLKGISRNYSVEDMLRLGTACSLAVITSKERKLSGEVDLMDRFGKDVTIQYLST
jgi:1-phosphofructokinase